MINKKWAGIIMLLTVSIISCKKDNDHRSDVKLAVDLQNHLIAVSDIDSANVVLRKNGTGTPILFRFDKGANKLEALIDGLPNGQWTADLDLYTKPMQSGKSYQFVSLKNITVANNSGTITIAGPDELGPDGWSARRVHATANNDIVVLIPLDVNDPYFEIRTAEQNWDHFSVERLATLGQAVVAHETWVCNNDCPGNDRLVFNKTHFIPFTQAIQNNDWSKNEIIITVGNIQQQLYNEFNNVWTD